MPSIASPLPSLTQAVHGFARAHGRFPTILVDADGVIYDWERGFVNTHRDLYPDLDVAEPGTRDRFDFFDALDAEHRAAALDVMNRLDYTTLAPSPGAVNAVQTMQLAGAHVLICTAPYLTNPTCESAKKAAVLRDFGTEFASTGLLIMRDKTNARGDILIDDKPYITGERDSEWTHVRFHQRYNVGIPGPRLRDWDAAGAWQDDLAGVLLGLCTEVNADA